MNHLYKICVTAILAPLLLADVQAQVIFKDNFEAIPCALVKKLTWDGGGDGVSWFDAANWTGDVLPANGESVSIQMTGQKTISFNNSSNTTSVRCLDSNQALSVAGGTLVITQNGTISPVITVSGGEFLATGDLQVVSSP